MFSKAALVASLIASVSGQQVGTLNSEKHPALPIQECTKAGCQDVSTSIVLDANWRWLHKVEGSQNCYDGQTWDTSVCSDGAACAEGCALEGADYTGTYGVSTSGGALKINFINKHQYGTNVGARVYLMASEDKYYMFKLLNKEFTFDVDVSKLPCGLNGALYLVEMPEDGGIGQGANKAGAKYGTGYCDTQCPHDIKFINGEANVDGWKGSPTDPSSGTGKYGACCHEMDIWEANSISAAYTPHNCKDAGLVRCEGIDCGDGEDRYKGICDKDGCDFNSFRQGNETFYGKGKIIDTSKPFKVVTQFITDDGTDTGKLKEIKRKYIQGDNVVENSQSNVEGIDAVNSITDEYCNAQKSTFQDTNTFGDMGGVGQMGASIGRGMVLALSIWDDHAAHMLWLDSTFPTDSTKPGAKRGECETSSGDPKDVETNNADSTVTYSNIKVGELDSTY